MKSFLAIVVIAILLVGGIYLWLFPGTLPNFFGGSEEPPPAAAPPADTRATYASTTLGLTVRYPSTFILDESYAYDAFGAQKLVHGVKFGIPPAMATGTNLSSDSYISVEWLPRANNCTGDIYLRSATSSTALTDGGVEYSVAGQTGAAAGNVYEEVVYALTNADPCMAVRYFIHSGNLDNYATGSVRAFNRGALLSEFDQIRRSLQLRSASAAPAATTTQP